MIVLRLLAFAAANDSVSSGCGDPFSSEGDVAFDAGKRTDALLASAKAMFSLAVDSYMLVDKLAYSDCDTAEEYLRRRILQSAGAGTHSLTRARALKHATSQKKQCELRVKNYFDGERPFSRMVTHFAIIIHELAKVWYERACVEGGEMLSSMHKALVKLGAQFDCVGKKMSTLVQGLSPGKLVDWILEQWNEGEGFAHAFITFATEAGKFYMTFMANLEKGHKFWDLVMQEFYYRIGNNDALNRCL